MKKSIFFLSGTIALLFASFYFLSNQSRAKKERILNPAFKQFIYAYTSGYINSESKIRVVLQDQCEVGDLLNKVTDNTLFKFSPGIPGKMIWIDANTVEFRPAEPLKNGEMYEAEFLLGEVAKVGKELKSFPFSFRVIPQAMEVEITDYSVVSGGKAYEISGLVSTADNSKNEEVEKTLALEYASGKSKIKWFHDSPKAHRFVLTEVERDPNSSGTLTLNYDAESIDGEQKGTIELEIPAIDEFKVIEVKIKNGSDQQATIFFSEILSEQNFAGLVSLSDGAGKNTGNDVNESVQSVEEQFTYSVEGNKLLIFPTSRYEGSRTLTLSNDIQSVKSYRLTGTKQFDLEFQQLLPEIRFTGDGNIIPGSDKLLLPFEAVNISSVDVTVKRVYENNILQFLQVNSLDGNYEMNRVGTVVFRKKIELSSLGTLPKNKWQNYALDLSKLIKTEPGAIYNVKLNFKRSYSIYDCQNDTSSVSTDFAEESQEEFSENTDEEGNWDAYSYDDDYYYYDYDYSQRDNPCHPSYYAYGRSITKNILSSNTGLVVKRGNDGTLAVMTSDLLSARPIGKVEVEAYDFQQQSLGKVLTDENGFARIEISKKPFVVIARNGKERAYVKLDDGNSLSMSMFDVEGQEVKKGMKGFIYGERGIWRPGDSLYLTFILENKDLLPETFPVSMEIVNPQGQVFQKMTRSKNMDGFYNFSTKTETYSPTGVWVAKVKAGGTTFTKNLRIETIMPNRLKLDLNFNTELLHGYLPLNGDLNVNWLHGAPGRNLETKVDFSLSSSKTEFKNFKEYNFDNPAAEINSETQTFFSGRTNQEGFTKVSGQIPVPENAPGFMRANFTVRAFEEGGTFSTDRFSLPISVYREYIGMKSPRPDKGVGYLYTGKNLSFDLVNVSESGAPVPAEAEVKVYKLSWRWWWDNYTGDFSSYMSSEMHTPIFSQMVPLNSGKGKFEFRVDAPEWGRYLVVAKNLSTGHTTGNVVFIDWPAWEGKSPKGNEGANFISVTTDKEVYSIKDAARIHFPSAEGTKAFITVENGSRVIKSFWATTSKDSTDAWLEITEEMTPNIYIYVTLLQPHSQTANDLPIRLYGVASVKVNNKDLLLHPKITTIEVWKPETEQVVKVSENDGREMTYTLAVVDEGLLDLTRFKTPDPYNAFYSKEALGVKTWDVFDQVLGATAGGIQRILAVGGDDALAKNDNQSAKRFVPMVRYIGPFHLKKGEVNSHRISVPQYVGSVRVMVVAGYQHAFGNDEKTIPVRKPLMILSTLPRVLGPGEEVDLPVTVFAMDKKLKSAKITVQTGSGMQLLEETSKVVNFERMEDKVVNFKLKVKDRLGWNTVKIFAEGAGETCKEEINIEVRSSNPVLSNITEGVLEAGKSFSANYSPVGVYGSNSAVLELSSIPALNLAKRLNYLIEYPHGCIEQTTSAVFAQLYLNKLTEISKSRQQQISSNIKAAVNKIKSFQTGSGGFAYWPGLNTADDWGTTYAGHFLLEAQKSGYVIPVSLLDNWKAFQKSKSQQWTLTKNALLYHEDITQAYRLYTLALAGIPELGAMNRMKENKSISTAAKWRLAAAYVLAGQKEVARNLIQSVSTKTEKYTELGYTYGCSERDDAMILETLTLLNEKTKAFEQMKKVAGVLSSENWLSTQTTAYSLLAISSFVEKNNSGTGVVAQVKFGKENVTLNSPKSFWQMELSNAESTAAIKIENKTKGMLFVRVVSRGVPAAGEEKEFTSGLLLNVVYKNMKGEVINVSQMEQGTDFVAELSVANNSGRGFLKNLSLTQLFPSGWEIHNKRLEDNQESFAKTDAASYQDIRDDRIYSYFDLGAGQKKVFRVILNASYTGRFYLPSVKAEAMYDNGILSAKKGMWVQVVKSGGV